MGEQQAAQAGGDFLEESREVGAGGQSGEEEGIQARKKGVDSLASRRLQHLEGRRGAGARARVIVVAGAEVRFLLLRQQFRRPSQYDINSAMHDGIDFGFER